MRIDRDDVIDLRDVLGRRVGLWLDDDRRLDELARFARDAVIASGGDLRAYVRRVDAPEAAELLALAERLTVSETFFFRNASQFDALAKVALPARIAARAATRHLRLLSAGCASGEEAYSMAIVLHDFAAALHGWDVQITGVDINQAVLARARAGRFTPWSLRSTPPEWQARWFARRGRELALDPGILRAVRFERRNLVSDASWPAVPTYDVIFLRNVLMYFSVDAARAVVRNVARSLSRGGYLFLGHAETLRGLSDELRLEHTHGAFYYYRPLETADTSPVPPSEPPGDGWFEAIRAASARIAALADRDGAPGDADASSGARARAGPTAERHDAGAAGDLERVWERLRAERYDDALGALDAAPAGTRDEPRARLLRAVLRLHTGAFDEAARAARSLLGVPGLDASAWFVIAMCEEHEGALEAAERGHRAAIEADASFAMPCLHLGLLARRAGRPTEALQALARAAELFALEDERRLALFGGGFRREALIQLCRAELERLEADR